MTTVQDIIERVNGLEASLAWQTSAAKESRLISSDSGRVLATIKTTGDKTFILKDRNYSDNGTEFATLEAAMKYGKFSVIRDLLQSSLQGRSLQ